MNKQQINEVCEKQRGCFGCPLNGKCGEFLVDLIITEIEAKEKELSK